MEEKNLITKIREENNLLEKFLKHAVSGDSYLDCDRDLQSQATAIHYAAMTLERHRLFTLVVDVMLVYSLVGLLILIKHLFRR